MEKNAKKVEKCIEKNGEMQAVANKGKEEIMSDARLGIISKNKISSKKNGNTKMQKKAEWINERINNVKE